MSPARRGYGRLLLPALALFIGLGVSASASADIRIWSDGGDAGDHAVGAAGIGPDRFLDFTAFAQPGLIFRQDDPNAGRTDDTFWLQRARLGIHAQLFPWLRFRLEVEFMPVTLLQDAFLELVPHPAFQFRVGQMLVPFLRAYGFNELNLGFLDRPLYIPVSPDRSFIRYLSARDVGAMFHGFLGADPTPAGRDPVFQYQVGAFIGRGANVTGNDNGVFLWAARFSMHLFGVPDGIEAESDLARNVTPRVAVAASAYSNCDDRNNWNRGFTVDSELRWEGIYASAGVVWFRNSPGDVFFAEGPGCRGQAGDDGSPLDFVSRGAHVQVQYVLHREIFPIHGMDLELMGRFDFVDPNSPYVGQNPLFGGGSNTPGYIAPANFTDSDNPPSRWRLTFGLNFFPTGQQSVRLGINYQINREAEIVRVAEGFIEAIDNDIFWLQITAGI